MVMGRFCTATLLLSQFFLVSLTPRVNVSTAQRFNRSRRSFDSLQMSLNRPRPLRLDSNTAAYLLDEHNKYRRMMKASNMNLLRWSAALAKRAKIHAERCLFQHSLDRVSSGENIWAAPYASLKDAVRFWFVELFDRKCGCTNHFKPCCGHYTQVVWADSQLVGCGMSRCESIKNAHGQRFILVCHYWPSGNWVHVRNNSLIGYPAFRHSKHGPCSECERNSRCVAGLCAALEQNELN